MLLEYITKKLLDEVISKLKRIYSDNNSKLKISTKDIEKSIDHHLNYVKNWSEIIAFKDLNSSRKLRNTYIDLDLYITPLSEQYADSERKHLKSFETVVKEETRHVILLGQPGAGKTTCMKKVCQLAIFDEDFRPNNSFPVLVNLKDLEEAQFPLFTFILNIFGITFESESKNEVTREFISKIIIEVLDKFSVILILEGYDEINEDSIRKKVGDEIKYLSVALNNALLILTSRTSDFKINIENYSKYELKSLSKLQIKSFVSKWLNDEGHTEKFLSQLSKSTFSDSAIKPLTLAHLCAIYERVGHIPDKPKTVYRKIVNLLLEEWDEQKNIKRKSKFSNFATDRKREFLSHLAFELTTNIRTFTFDKYIFHNIYVNTLSEIFNLPIDDAKNITDEIESHSGLFVQTSYVDFEFCHKSIQEYLCAEYLISLPTIPDFNILRKIPNEMAIAVSLSLQPTNYFYHLITNTLFEEKWFDLKNIELASNADREFVTNVFIDFIETFLDRLDLENPDFDSSPTLAITYLYLYTLLSMRIPMSYYNNYRDSDSSRDSRSNLLIRLEKKYFKNKTVKISMSNLLNYYDLIDNARIGKQQLVRNMKIFPSKSRIPNYLNVNSSFF